MAMGMKGFVSDIFDRVRHVPEDMTLGYYLPAEKETGWSLKNIGTVSGATAESLLLGGALLAPILPTSSILLVWLGSMSGLVSYTCINEKGRAVRKAMEHKPQ